MAWHLKDRHLGRQECLATALRHMATTDPDKLEQRRTAGKLTWLAAGLSSSLSGRYPPPSVLDDYTVLAVDGSHIDVDRHLAARCALINIGQVTLRYGSHPQAHLESQPYLLASDKERLLRDPNGAGEQAIEGTLLGVKRSIEEIRTLATLASKTSHAMPTVALLDGSLALWSLSGQRYPEFVRRTLLEDTLIPALDTLFDLSRTLPLTMGSYISLPNTTDIVSILRLAECPYPTVNCDQHCRGLASGGRPCDPSALDLTDRDLFAEILAPYERSDVFRSTSSIVEQYYGAHGLFFFYLNVGEEIARVEMPSWIANDEEKLGVLHRVLLSQCEKGLGYPVSLSEAHEQAVITSPDREHFRLLVEQALNDEHLPISTSEKALSKRLKLA
jgi:hypothetical protein